MLGFVSAHIPWNAISNLELQQSYKPSRSDLVLPFATTRSNICPREYPPSADALQMQLASRNNESLALDGWTSTGRIAITSVIAYYMDQNRSLHEVQLAFDEIDRLFSSAFES